VIERLTDMPPGTIGFRAAGEIEREDYDEVLVPELRRALEAGGGLRTLYLIEDLDEIEPGALWADTKLGFDLGVRHHEAWISLRHRPRHVASKTPVDQRADGQQQGACDR
jgi:SpoIIAA-like